MRRSLILLFIMTLQSCAHSEIKIIKPKRESPVPQKNKTNKITQKARIQKTAPKRTSRFLRKIHGHKMRFWVKYFTQRDRQRFKRYLKNGARYKKMVQSIFKSYGLPTELYYVGLIESGYYLESRSHASAKGPWQFMKETGQNYGLTINRYIDERESIFKSTHAAAKYMRHLYHMFGSWELALSAYNAGENGIKRRIKRGRSKNYYTLSRLRLLPKETRHYIPKVLAVMHILKNPKRYGLRVPRPHKNLLTKVKTFKIKPRIKVNRLITKLGVSRASFYNLNNDLKTKTLPVTRKGFTLFVPRYSKINRTKKYLSYLQSIRPKHHVVKRGDYLIKIARRYGVSLRALKNLNDLKRGRIYPGQKLLVSN